MQDVAKHKPIFYYEICNGDNTTSYYPLSNEEVNFLGPHQRKRNIKIIKKFKRGNNSNYNQGWLQNVEPSTDINHIIITTRLLHSKTKIQDWRIL